MSASVLKPLRAQLLLGTSWRAIATHQVWQVPR